MSALNTPPSASSHQFRRKLYWYEPHRRLRTPVAAERAKTVVRWIESRKDLAIKPEEQDLFAAMHTCAYQAARPARSEHIPESQRIEWAQRWRTIREHLVEQNLGLVYAMIGRMALQSFDRDDVHSEAMFALVRAVDRFSPWRGFQFSTYACNVISRALMRNYRRAADQRRPRAAQYGELFEEPVPTTDRHTDLCVDRLHKVLESNVCKLTEVESNVLIQRFLTDNDRTATFREIGQTIGLSKERVRQIQNDALDKLRRVLNRDAILK